MITQSKYNVLRQPTRKIKIKIDLINENDFVVDSFEGIATEGSVNLTSESTNRRSGHLTMVFDEKYNLLPSPDSKIWFNKRCAITIGIKSYSGDIIPFKLGRFALDEVSLNFDNKQKIMSCQLKDYMSFLDGTLGGTLSHPIIIDEGTPMSDAIKSALVDLGKVSVENIELDGVELKLPYTIEKDRGSNVYDILQELINIYPKWDFYFDEDGYLIVEKINDKSTDPIVESFDGKKNNLTISKSPKFDFKNVKNSIWVWGRELDDGRQVKWNYRNRWSRKTASELNTLEDKQNGDICFIKDENNSYLWNKDKWELLNFNVIPIFNVEKLGEKKWTYSEDSIFNDEQAQLRCEYELEKRSNMAESISFNCVPLYYLNIFDKVYININNLIQGDYIITSISIPLDISSPMNINVQKIYN